MTEKELLKNLEQRLTSEYKDTLSVINNRIAYYTKNFDADNKMMQSRVKSGAISKAEYKKWYKNQITTAKWCNDMIAELSNDMTTATVKASEIINGATADSFTLGMIEGSEEIAKDTAFDVINRKQVETLLNEDKDLLPKASPKVKKEQLWNKRRMRSSVMQSAIKGESVPQLAKRLEVVVGMGKTSAIRNARTMMTATHNMGKMKVGEEAMKRGIDIQKKWLATYDNRTRDSHALMNDEVVNADEEFSNGLMFPGDPDGDPSEVYNCRCAFRYVHEEPHEGMSEEEFDEKVGEVAEKKEAFKEANKKLKEERAEQKEAPKPAKAEQPKTEEKPSISFKPANSIDEAEQYAKDNFIKGGINYNYTGKPISYKGVDLNVANKINQRLTEIYGQYNIDQLASLEAFGKKNKRLYSTNKEAPFMMSTLGNLGMNTEMMKNSKLLLAYSEEGKKSFQYVLDNIDTLTGKNLELALTYKTAGRGLVDNSLEGMITHEVGHHISHTTLNKVLGNIQRETDWEKYAQHISGYANHSFGEYIAESWTAYYNGETKILQPEIYKAFESLKK